MLYIFIFMIRSSIWRNCANLEQKQNKKKGKIIKHNTTNPNFQFFYINGEIKCSKLPLTLFYTSQAFQQDQDHSSRNPDKGDTHSGSWNKKEEATT